MKTDHKDIVSWLKSSPSAAYKRLYKDHFGMVSHLVRKNNGSEADVKDVFQDAVIALFEMVSKTDFELSSELSTLLYSIARNIWFKRLRIESKKTKVKDFEKYIEVDDYDFEKDEKVERMEQELERLGEPCRGLLHAFYYLKKSMNDIADEFGYSGSSHAKTQKYKCLQRLKRSMST